MAGTFTEIPLWARDGSVRDVAIADAGDAVKLQAYRWHKTAGYAATRIDGRETYMHRLLLGHPDGQTDHINRNKLDNRRGNLRVVSDAENKQNVPGRSGRSSPYRGVCWDRSRRRWLARAIGQGKRFCQRFDDELEAAHAVERWRLENLPFAVPEEVT